MAHNTDTTRYKSSTILTLATDVITPVQAYHIVAAESGTADNLATINTSGFSQLSDGSNTFRPFVVLQADTGDTITVKHNTGNIFLNSTTDFTLTGEKLLVLWYQGSKWSDGSASATGGSAPFDDATAIVKGSSDATKLLRFEVDGFTTGTTRVATPPNEDFTIVGLASTQTLTNKTLTQFKLTDATTLTISSGAVTRTQGYHKIDTESAAATDDLDTISGGAAGDVLVIVAANTARTVVVRHNGGGSGNIRTFDGLPIALDETYKAIELVYDGTNWNVTAGNRIRQQVTQHFDHTGSNFSTTSTTYVDVDSSVNFSFVTTGGNIYVEYFFLGIKATAGTGTFRVVLNDGSDITPDTDVSGAAEVTINNNASAFAVVVRGKFTGRAAGTYTVKIQYKSSNANSVSFVLNGPSASAKAMEY